MDAHEHAAELREKLGIRITAKSTRSTWVDVQLEDLDSLAEDIKQLRLALALACTTIGNLLNEIPVTSADDFIVKERTSQAVSDWLALVAKGARS